MSKFLGRSVNLAIILKRYIGSSIVSLARSSYKKALEFESNLVGHANPSISLNYLGNAKDNNQGLVAPIKLKNIMLRLDSNIKTINDIGCNNGYYAANLAKSGYFVYGYEPDINLFQRCFFEVIGLSKSNENRLSISTLAIDQQSVAMLPQVDATLLLSVLHYWVEEGGWSYARSILEIIWSRTNKILFFELPNPISNIKLRSALSDMGATEDECLIFLKEFLSQLPCSDVEFIDYLSTDFRNNEKRHLFAVRRVV